MSVGTLDVAASCVVAEDATMAVLGRINEHEVQLAIWNRALPRELERISAPDWDEIDDVEASIAGPDFGNDIAVLLRNAGYEDDALRRDLAAEIGRLTQRFAAAMSCRAVRLRLDVIQTDGCRRFHMDYVTVRMLAPLVGPGTQWRLGEAGPIRELIPGDVALFKGRMLVDEPAILHRSPPMTTPGASRLLLVLDVDRAESATVAVDQDR